MDKIDVALIGAGRMGAMHVTGVAQHPQLRLKFVIDPRAEMAQALADRYGAQVTTLGTALADASVRGVLVCSSTDKHLEHALEAIAAGKAVFSEKPIDLDVQRAQAAAEHFRDKPFVLGFNRRFDPHFLRLKQRLEQDAIGTLESLYIINHDPAAPPPGFVPTSGGLFKDFTIHDLDMARWLLGEEPTQIYAAASCLVDPDIGRQGDVDTARTVLKTASGRLCVISNTRRSGCGYDQRIEAFGSRGMLRVGNVTHDATCVLTEQGATSAAIKPDFPSRYRDSYHAEVAHFADVLSGRDQPRATYADGLAALALAEACARSARSGQTQQI
jgi:myo-inositol 2-dehydrogenase/D-chiro-inositol 1-dehydrogenase